MTKIGGEEQGLFGSKAYVKEHFGDQTNMQLKPEHAKLSGYFNVDNGTGAIRGVYLQGNEAVAPIFQSWMEPFKNLGMTTLTIRNTDVMPHRLVKTGGSPVSMKLVNPGVASTGTLKAPYAAGMMPHMSSATLEARIDMGEKVIINIKTFADGHRPPDRVIGSML